MKKNNYDCVDVEEQSGYRMRKPVYPSGCRGFEIGNYARAKVHRKIVADVVNVDGGDNVDVMADVKYDANDDDHHGPRHRIGPSNQVNLPFQVFSSNTYKVLWKNKTTSVEIENVCNETHSLRVFRDGFLFRRSETLFETTE